MNAAALLANARVVPVIVIEDTDTAVPLARTLFESGLPAIEVTLRTSAAVNAIRDIAAEVPEILVGAGSLRTPDQVDAVRDAGAAFGVSPGSSSTLLEAVAAANLPFIPGAVTPSESLQLLDRGYTLQKFFPASVAGGLPYLKALGAPLPEVSFMPTGGVSADNATDYLSLANVACVGGSWIAPQKTLAARDFETIGKLAAHASQLGGRD
ncbi:MAG: bifunctional 4-hydroxy-2-oxoglutarate aldolase/2-dehydro-3-deoxy-phosphogluconate aldolase [Woeseiaceae bacterium]|nr:bifunctional 4-hydroxy-2-oxoglutarate aldolase/2-dehydro-3-deoxy-phosphogluconate aldolase [Woeseiaceae bacterium]